MGRSGYSDDGDSWELIKYRGQVASAIRGKRGQKLLLDLVHALDALPVKRLIAEELQYEGEVCALGAVGKVRGVPMDGLNPDDTNKLADTFNVARCLACEIMYENDEAFWGNETPEHRWERMRAWAIAKLQPVEDEFTTIQSEQGE